MKRERLQYFAIEYFIYLNSTLPNFPLEIVNVLPSDVRYAERFRYYPRIAPCARYDYLLVPDTVIYFLHLNVAAFQLTIFSSRGTTELLLTNRKSFHSSVYRVRHIKCYRTIALKLINHIQKWFRQKFQCPIRPSY